MISARLVRARFAAAAPAVAALLGVACLCAAAFGTIAEHQAEREARAARAEHWAAGPLRPEREFRRAPAPAGPVAKLEQPEDRP